MISKQEYFERFGIIHEIDEHIRRCVSAPTNTVLWTRWRETRLMCIDLAIDELPAKQKRVIKDIYYSKLDSWQIARKLHTKQRNVIEIKRRAIGNLRHNILVKFFIQHPDS